MCELREFDLRCRGATGLVEDWKRNHLEVRKVWKAEDVIRVCNECCDEAIEVYDHFRQHPDLEAPYRFSHFVDMLEALLAAFNQVCDQGSLIADQGYAVRGLDDLQRKIPLLEAIVREDRFATEMAFNGGALDGWD